MAEYQTANESANSKRMNPSLPRPLRLKVIGTARHGQMIEIFSTRLTIGSAPQCTLRLRAAGVGPLQCLIVREPSGPVARSLSVDTLLNGQRFRDEPLHSGDRLQLGSIELELCDDARPIVAALEHSTRTRALKQPLGKSELSPWTEAKSQRPLEFLARIERLEQQFNQLREVDHATSTAPGKPPVEEQQVTSEAASRLTTAADVPDTHTKSQQQAAEQQRFKSELEHANEQHERAQCELARLQAERDALQTRYEEIAHSHRAVEEWLRNLQAELERQGHESQAAFDSQRQHWQLQRSAAVLESKHLQETLSRLMEQQSEANRARAELEKALATERHLRGELEQKVEQQSVRVSELQAQCLSLQANVEQWQSDQLARAAATQPVHQTASSVVESRTEESLVGVCGSPSRRQERDWLAQQVAAVETEPVELSPEEVSQSSAAAPSYVPIAQSANDLPDVQQPIVTPTVLRCGDSLFESWVSSFNAQMDLDSEALQDDSAAAADTDAVTAEESPSETDRTSDVFTRLSLAGIWKNADDQGEFSTASQPVAELAHCSTGNDESEESVCLSGSRDDMHERATSGLYQRDKNKGYAAPVIEAEKVNGECSADDPGILPNQVADAPTGRSSGEDSIEAYMQRLLQRVRGDSSGSELTLPTISPDADRSPQTEAKLDLAEPARPSGPTVLTESEYQPRSQAPEMGANFAAMRAIGNDSRKKNILKHAQRTWTDRSKTKLIGSVAGLALAFASFFYLDTNTELAAAGLFVGFGVAGFWIWQAIRCRKQLFDSMRQSPDERTTDELDGDELSPPELETSR